MKSEQNIAFIVFFVSLDNQSNLIGITFNRNAASTSDKLPDDGSNTRTSRYKKSHIIGYFYPDNEYLYLKTV